MKNILGYPQGNLSRVGSYIGFESEGFCYNPAIMKSYFMSTKFKDAWKCDRSDTGFYNPVCRGWYKKQQSNPDVAVMTDLYEFAGERVLLGMTFCVPLRKQNAITGEHEFYGALCSDLKLTLEQGYHFSEKE
jgi:hypothetical protein